MFKNNNHLSLLLLSFLVLAFCNDLFASYNYKYWDRVIHYQMKLKMRWHEY